MCTFLCDRAYLPSYLSSLCHTITKQSSMLQSNTFIQTLIVFFTCFCLTEEAKGFSCNMLYGITDSKWSSPKWNWGYASGSGHDCALICRRKFSTQESRRELIEGLISSSIPECLEEDNLMDELKLILGLTWQRGRRDGTDGGVGGYSEVLFNLADCQYETFFECDDGIACQRNFLNDMKARYHLISENQIEKVQNLSDEFEDLDKSIRVCAGMILNSMDFIRLGM